MQKPARALGEVLRNLFAKKATSDYPFAKAVVAPRYRGRIAFDSATCIGCKMCVRVCPAKAIEIVLSAEQPPAPAVEPGAAAAPARKKFDCLMSLDRCIYCAQCVDVCPKKSLTSTQDFELAHVDRKTLKWHYK
ncbi:MAG TPA: 4Fe-4S binding protein [Elusimicrobiales bacterium]|nr:4Fe-4S binding protein [Elusimicrobiales bacterium]